MPRSCPPYQHVEPLPEQFVLNPIDLHWRLPDQFQLTYWIYGSWCVQVRLPEPRFPHFAWWFWPVVARFQDEILRKDVNTNKMVAGANVPVVTKEYGIWPPIFLVDFSNILLYFSLKIPSATSRLPLPFISPRLSSLARKRSSFVNTTIIGTIATVSTAYRNVHWRCLPLCRFNWKIFSSPVSNIRLLE